MASETRLIQDKEYELFHGAYCNMMPLLRQEGFRPLTSKEIMSYRVKALQSQDKNEREFWLEKVDAPYEHRSDTESNFNTSDGLVSYGEHLMVVPNAEILLNIHETGSCGCRFVTFSKKRPTGALELNLDQYNELSQKYESFKYGELLLNRELSENEARNHPLWLKMAQDDRALLEEYVDCIFREFKDNEKNMVFYPLTEGYPEAPPLMLNLELGSFNGCFSSRGVEGNGLIWLGGNILIGVRPSDLLSKLYRKFPESKLLRYLRSDLLKLMEK
ncbi:hypothetical protein CEE44_00015 [Candidatus Woesearchaeota archaeon B3_Woes]|nr:MAG: hypothetical protein CEE44_00015 [Candidatus Woesearchaeota archaeon B3_Woes]